MKCRKTGNGRIYQRTVVQVDKEGRQKCTGRRQNTYKQQRFVVLWKLNCQNSHCGRQFQEKNSKSRIFSTHCITAHWGSPIFPTTRDLRTAAVCTMDFTTHVNQCHWMHNSEPIRAEINSLSMMPIFSICTALAQQQQMSKWSPCALWINGGFLHDILVSKTRRTPGVKPVTVAPSQHESYVCRIWVTDVVEDLAEMPPPMTSVLARLYHRRFNSGSESILSHKILSAGHPEHFSFKILSSIFLLVQRIQQTTQ